MDGSATAGEIKRPHADADVIGTNIAAARGARPRPRLDHNGEPVGRGGLPAPDAIEGSRGSLRIHVSGRHGGKLEEIFSQPEGDVVADLHLPAARG